MILSLYYSILFTTALPKVLGNKRDLPGALGESELIQMMGLNSVQVQILLESMIMVIKLMIMMIKLATLAVIS